MEAEMFEHQDIILLLAKERHQDCLAEMERIRKIRMLKKTDPPGSLRFKKMMLRLADLLIAMGGSMKRRFGAGITGSEDGVVEGSGHAPAPDY
jgi:hypothetical protein